MKRKITQRGILCLSLLGVFGFDSVLAQGTCTGASIDDWADPRQVVRYEIAGAKPLGSSYAASEQAFAYFSNGDSIEISPDKSIAISLLGTTVRGAFLNITEPTFRFSAPPRSGSYTLRVGKVICTAGASGPTSASGASLEATALDGSREVVQTDLYLIRVTK